MKTYDYLENVKEDVRNIYGWLIRQRNVLRN